MRFASRPVRIVVAAMATIALPLLAAPAALADNGTGLAGPTTDKGVTFVCFGVIGFFAVLVIALTLVQEGLERRKERRRYELERYG